MSQDCRATEVCKKSVWWLIGCEFDPSCMKRWVWQLECNLWLFQLSAIFYSAAQSWLQMECITRHLLQVQKWRLCTCVICKNLCMPVNRDSSNFYQKKNSCRTSFVRDRRAWSVDLLSKISPMSIYRYQCFRYRFFAIGDKWNIGNFSICHHTSSDCLTLIQTTNMLSKVEVISQRDISLHLLISCFWECECMIGLALRAILKSVSVSRPKIAAVSFSRAL